MAATYCPFGDRLWSGPLWAMCAHAPLLVKVCGMTSKFWEVHLRSSTTSQHYTKYTKQPWFWDEINIASLASQNMSYNEPTCSQKETLKTKSFHRPPTRNSGFFFFAKFVCQIWMFHDVLSSFHFQQVSLQTRIFGFACIWYFHHFVHSTMKCWALVWLCRCDTHARNLNQKAKINSKRSIFKKCFGFEKETQIKQPTCVKPSFTCVHFCQQLQCEPQ